MLHLIRRSLLAVATVCVCGLVAYAAEGEFKATCPVSGQPVDETKFVEYKDAKVYFCCGNCPGAFKKDTAKFAAKANHQLVGTKQFAQKACPLSGGKLNADKTVEIGDVKVGFCCENCQGKVAAAKEPEQLELVFADKPFEKGFELKKEEK